MARGNRYKNDNKPKKKLFAVIILIFFLILLIISASKIIGYIKDNKDNEKVFDEISKDILIEDKAEIENEEDKYKIDFASLKEKNSDTVGFLKVNGTDIEFVVVKGKDNSYYLNHNFEKHENVAGWIFADYNNKLDGSDKNIIIYGHNMKNGTMFASLKNILTEEWQKNEDNRKIVFITENEKAMYEVFSVYQVEDEAYYVTTNFKEGEFKKFVDKIKSRSKYNFEVEVSENDNILTLSTCANNNKYRVVLHAKKVK